MNIRWLQNSQFNQGAFFAHILIFHYFFVTFGKKIIAHHPPKFVTLTHSSLSQHCVYASFVYRPLRHLQN